MTQLMERGSAPDDELEFLGGGTEGNPFSREADGVKARGFLKLYRPNYDALLQEAAQLYTDVLRGHRPIWRLQEALTRSDFPILFADITDRAVWGEYQQIPVDWSSYVKEEMLSNFIPVKRFTQDGLNAPLEPVGELQPYPTAQPSEGVYQFGLGKYGRSIEFSWELAINNDLGILERIPARSLKAARNGEARAVTRLYAGVNGPNGNFFTAPNGNIVQASADLGTPINPPLSQPALMAALTQIATGSDAAGNPIYFSGFALVVPPSLELKAQALVNIREIRTTAAMLGGATGVELLIDNPIGNRVTPVVDPWIPKVATTANGNTTWFLIGKPVGNARPAFVHGRLRSESTPSVFIKAPDATRLGGGSDSMDGSFLMDAIAMKIRDVHGGTQADPKAAVASNGSGV